MCRLLALLEAHHILHVSRIRVKYIVGFLNITQFADNICVKNLLISKVSFS